MARNVKVLIAQIILALAFLFFGVTKFLTSPAEAANVFGSIGGTTAQYFTGAYEVISGILVVIPATALIGAIMIIVSMVVAILLHLTILGFSGPFIWLTVIAVVLLALATYVFVALRSTK